jgi:nucleotide-binding universal stress UspA family protein
MSGVLVERDHRRSGLGRILVVFDGSRADERALESALELAGCAHASLHAVLLEGEHRGYSVSADELARMRAARHGRFVEDAFRLSDRAHAEGVRLPLELVGGAGNRRLCRWIDAGRFGLVVVAHDHRPFSEYLPMSIVARVRRSTSCPVLVVK